MASNPGKTSRVSSTRMLTVTAIMAAIATVLILYLQFPVIPAVSFLKMDFSTLPALLASFALGPLSGAAVCLLKDLINMIYYQDYIGSLCDFVLSVAFVVPAGLIYRYMRTRKGALIGSLTGAVFMAALSFPLNLFVIYPLYYHFIMPEQAVLGLYQAIPFIQSIPQGLLVVNVPFTLVKGLIIAAICFVIYKPLSPLLKGRHKA